MSPATTSPEWSASRARTCTPKRRSHSGRRRASSAWMESAVLQATGPCRSSRTGAPQKAMSASPEYSTWPPVWRTRLVSSPK